MKKTITLLMILTVVITSSCSTSIKQKNDKVELNTTYVSSEALNYYAANNYEQLFEVADYVVVATPQQNIEESEQFWYVNGTQSVENFDQADLIYSFSKRDFKVQKVFKGENKDLKEISVCEYAITDGAQIKIFDGEYIAEKNHKYLLFLIESKVTKGLYFTTFYQGKYDLKEKNNEENKNINKELYKEIKEYYKSNFTN